MLGFLPQVNLSIDAAIFGTIVALIIAGAVLGQSKVKTFALSVYVGLVLAGELGQPIFDFLNGRGMTFGGRMGVATVRLLLLIIPVVGLELGHNKHQRGQRRGMVLTMILCLMTAALLVASALALLEPEPRQAILDQSTLASLFYGLRLWWIAAVPVVAIVESLVKPKRD